MRSDANFRLSECQPRPRFGSRPASPSALFHQPREIQEPTLTEGSLDEGSTGALPVTRFRPRAGSKAAIASAVTGVRCSYPVFSCSLRHRMVSRAKSMSDQRTGGGPNHGKESSKFNQDCTICRTCRSTISDSTVPKQRGNATKWRDPRVVSGPMSATSLELSPSRWLLRRVHR